ncbi:DMT family transporter [Actinopolymorpha alba]|uniref:DMT family transporter n=1 Tax=Actinopolymorpha alba TaxID=533267 RepID=UPI00036E79D3|nr:SMR family transporter [Actinopolymorpha alba]
MTWLYLSAAIASEVSASLALRAAVDAPLWYALVAVGYTASFILIAAVLRRGMPVGVAYGVWAACGVATTAVAAAALFSDPLTWTMGAGFAAIIAGVLLIELGSHPPERRTSHAGGATHAGVTQ